MHKVSIKKNYHYIIHNLTCSYSNYCFSVSLKEKESLLTARRKNFERLIRFKWFTQTNFVSSEYPYHIFVIFLQIPDGEFLHTLLDSADLHPHGLLRIPDGNVVTQQWCSAIWFGNTPFNNDCVRSNGSYFEWRSWRRWYRWGKNKLRNWQVDFLFSTQLGEQTINVFLLIESIIFKSHSHTLTVMDFF